MKTVITNSGYCCLIAKSCLTLFATPWTVACQASLSMEFLRQEYYSRLPVRPSGDLLDPGIEPASLESPELADIFLTTEQGRGRLFSTYRHEDNNLLHGSS